MPSELENIFSGDDICVEISMRSQEKVVFSFSGYKSYENENPRYGENFLRSIGVTAVFFTALKDHWWQSPEMPEAIEAANSYTKGIPLRTTYGQSMGGFGAAIFANSLRSRYFVTAPQMTICDCRAPLHSVWRDCISRFKNTYIDISESAPLHPGIIAFDPRDHMDAAHATLINNCPNPPLRLVCPFATHYIPRALAEMGVLSTISSRFLANEFKEREVKLLRKKIRRNRLKSETYLKRITTYLKRKGKYSLLNAVFQHTLKAAATENSEISQLPHIIDFIENYTPEERASLPRETLLGIKSCEPIYQLTSLKSSPGCYTSTGGDPQMLLKVTQAESKKLFLEVRMYSTVHSVATVYWASDDQPSFSGERKLSARVTVGSNTLRFSLKDIPPCEEIRFDPLEKKGFIYISKMEILP